MPLNADQRRVVDNVTQHICLNAPPGTGKTEALAERILHLVQDCSVDPSEILCLTHTNAAAESMRDRLASVLSRDIAVQVNVTTIHSLAHTMIDTSSKYLASVVDRRIASRKCHQDKKRLHSALWNRNKTYDHCYQANLRG